MAQNPESALIKRNLIISNVKWYLSVKNMCISNILFSLNKENPNNKP